MARWPRLRDNIDLDGIKLHLEFRIGQGRYAPYGTTRRCPKLRSNCARLVPINFRFPSRLPRQSCILRVQKEVTIAFSYEILPFKTQRFKTTQRGLSLCLQSDGIGRLSGLHKHIPQRKRNDQPNKRNPGIAEKKLRSHRLHGGKDSQRRNLLLRCRADEATGRVAGMEAAAEGNVLSKGDEAIAGLIFD